MTVMDTTSAPRAFLGRRGMIAVAVVWAGALQSAGAAGADASSGSGPLTLEQAVVRALSLDAGLAAATATAIASRGQAESLALMVAPTLKLSADRDQATAGSTPRSTRSKVELNWSPPQWGERSLVQDRVRSVADQSEADRLVTRARVVWQVRHLHGTLEALQRMEPLSREIVDLSGRAVQVAEAQVAAGRRTRLELLGLQQQWQGHEAAHQDLLMERQSAMRSLAAAVGLPGDTELALPASSGPQVLGRSVGSAGDAESSALRLRPELQAVEARCAAVEAETRLKEQDNQRWIRSIGTTYTPRSADRVANVGLQAEVYLPGPGDRNGSAASLATLRQACVAQRQSVVQAIAQEARDAHGQALRAAHAARAQLRQLGAAEEALRLLTSARAAARADESDLLAGRSTVAQSRLLALRRLLDAQRAELALLHATGQVLSDLALPVQGMAGR
jgi:outer membrane protein TolC